MRFSNKHRAKSTTELQIRLRPGEVDGFIDMVLGATHSPVRRALVDGMKKECLL